jgi:hypothetical protein
MTGGIAVHIVGGNTGGAVGGGGVASGAGSAGGGTRASLAERVDGRASSAPTS